MPTTNSQRLLSLVQTHSPSQSFLSQFRYFHLSVSQKLWSLNYFCARIDHLEPEVRYIPRTDTSQAVVDAVPDLESFSLYANMYIDGFLMNSMAALDTLAHEISVLYSFQSLPNNLYIRSINHLRRDHPSSHITAYLYSEPQRPWFVMFANYRNCTTHESLVGSQFNTERDLVSGETRFIVPLPDDPTVRPFTFNRRLELKSYCIRTKGHVMQIVRHSYTCILQDLLQANHVLPIP